MLEIVKFVLGPVETNTYLVADPSTGEAVCIDPAWDGEVIQAEAVQRGWQITSIWLTHAHFDHFAGAAGLTNHTQPAPKVYLHALDKPLWRLGGGAPWFGLTIEPGPEPSVLLEHGKTLSIGDNLFEVRHVPGHTPGHVIFYCSQAHVAFTGDVIFQGSIGRTDFPGGDTQQLLTSIGMQVLSLPDETRLLSGHGPETNVRNERETNPFLG